MPKDLIAYLEATIVAMNKATKHPANRIRYHFCCGNYEGPTDAVTPQLRRPSHRCCRKPGEVRHVLTLRQLCHARRQCPFELLAYVTKRFF
jgi:hypothetical protein